MRRTSQAILCVDIGNSAIKYALVNPGGTIGAAGSEDVETRVKRSQRIAFKGLSRWKRRINGAIVCSVAPSLTSLAVAAITSLTGRRPRVVDTRMRLPFALHVPFPQTIGTDRICAAAGAITGGRKNAIIIDIGSAITVDLVRRGSFRGGVILAGPALSLRSLAEHTEKLPDLDLGGVGHLFPRKCDETEKSMILGAGFSAVGGIREAAHMLEKTAGGRVPTFVTGGMAPAVIERLPGSWRFDPYLVFKGLYHLWNLNPSMPTA